MIIVDDERLLEHLEDHGFYGKELIVGNTKILCAFVGMTLVMGGCISKRPPLFTPSHISNLPLANREGLYHKLRPGETVWRVSKTYGVDVDTILRVNSIQNHDSLRVGQLLFVPITRTKSSRQHSSQTLPLKSHKKISTESSFRFPLSSRGKALILFGQNKRGVKSKGIDIQAKVNSSVLAAKTGVVTFSNNLRGMGKMIVLDHQDGYTTVYAQLGKMSVQEGEVVKQGQIIGTLSPQEGKLYPSLHFQIRKKGKALNPLSLLPRH